MTSSGIGRRGVVIGAVAATMSTAALAQNRTDTDPRTLNGAPVPEPPAERSAGPVTPGRGSSLAGKVAVVTGAARGIGRAIAVEFAANGADVVAVDIAGPVSPASNAVPATPEELDETVRQIKGYGRRGEAIKADIRDIAALRSTADRVEQSYGKIDIVVANAAIQRWKPLLRDGRSRLGRRDQQQSEWHRQHSARVCAQDGLTSKRPLHSVVVDARQARHQGRGQLFGVEMGHFGPDEISRPGIRSIQHHCECACSWPRRYRAHPLRSQAHREHGRDRPEAP